MSPIDLVHECTRKPNYYRDERGALVSLRLFFSFIAQMASFSVVCYMTGTDAEARPGVMRLMDEARQAGIKVAVCSAATKSSVVHVVKSLLGDERFEVNNQHHHVSIIIKAC